MSKQNFSRDTKRVVVIGAGGSGLAAAVGTLQAHSNIDLTVLEQNDTYGGVTAIATGTIRACDTSLQKAINREGVTEQDALKQYQETGDYKQDLSVLNTFVEKSAEAVDWLISLGCKIELFNDYRHMIAPAKEGLSGGTGMTEALYQAAVKLGAKFMFNTRATELLTENGRVCGIKATAKDGKLVQLEADAVVLADGGYWGAKPGAFDKDIPPHLKEVIIGAQGSYPQGGSGDAARMAQAVGAELQNMDALDYTAQRYINAEGKLCPIYGSATIWSEAACIILNQSLDRFLSEDLCYAKETLTDRVAEELTRRHEKWFWNVWDEKSKENAYRVRYWISQGFIEQGFILVGQSVEELAKKMGVDPSKLKATMDKYNQNFSLGLKTDAQFGRNLVRERVHALVNPPFYAMRTGIECNNRRGGISTDKYCRALSKDKQPIPGLYAAGSSMNSVKFDGMGWLSGTGLTSCVVWGRIAGESAAKGR